MLLYAYKPSIIVKLHCLNLKCEIVKRGFENANYEADFDFSQFEKKVKSSNFNNAIENYLPGQEKSEVPKENNKKK